MIKYWLSLYSLLLLLTPVASAEVYRWVDENGQVHFEDRSKAQAESGVRKYSTPLDASETPEQRMEKTRKLLNAYQAERRQTRDAKEEKKKKQAALKRKCMVARDDLRRYRDYGNIYQLDKDGKRVYMSDQERDALIQSSREKVARYCGG